MKHTMKQAMALFIAVLLAMLGHAGALSEGIVMEAPAPMTMTHNGRRLRLPALSKMEITT